MERKLTEYGFKYGAAEVTRLYCDEVKGYVSIWVKTPKADIQVYVTKTGKVRVFDKNGTEWKPAAPTAQGGEK